MLLLTELPFGRRGREEGEGRQWDTSLTVQSGVGCMSGTLTRSLSVAQRPMRTTETGWMEIRVKKELWGSLPSD